MTLLLALLALPGIAAVLLRWFTALFATARYSVERFAASQIADQRAHRGDISGMAEADRIRRAAREKQLRGALLTIVWSAALVGPILVPGTFLLYMLYGLLWFTPSVGKEVEGR